MKCIFPKDLKQSKKGAIFGVPPAILASMQVMEVIKLIIKIENPLLGKRVFIDVKEPSLNLIKIEKNSYCPVCG